MRFMLSCTLASIAGGQTVVEDDLTEVGAGARECQERRATLLRQHDRAEVAAGRRQELERGPTPRGAREPERELLGGAERLAHALARDRGADDHIALGTTNAAPDRLGGLGHRGGQDGETECESERAHADPLSDESPASIGRNGPPRYALEPLRAAQTWSAVRQRALGVGKDEPHRTWSRA